MRTGKEVALVRRRGATVSRRVTTGRGAPRHQKTSAEAATPVATAVGTHCRRRVAGVASPVSLTRASGDRPGGAPPGRRWP